MSTDWQKIEAGELKHSSVHHLMAVHQLLTEQGYARTTDISKKLNITRGSVSITLSRLEESNFIKFDANKHISLTKKGQKIVEDVLHKRKILSEFYIECLQMEEHEALKCACRMEHVISQEVLRRLEIFAGFCREKIVSLPDFQTLRTLLNS